MAPNRGITAHFTAGSKASISRSNSSRSAKSKLAKDAAAPVSKVGSVQPAPESASTSIANDVAPKPSITPKPTTPKKRQTRTRLRTPEEGEVDRIIAENQSLLSASPSRLPSSSTLAEPPLELLGTPPSTPRSPLLEATHTSPISVRTDPDTKKLFLLLPKSSPTKRKPTTPPSSSSPTKTPRTTASSRRLITGEEEVLGTEEEDGLVLTPGKSKGTRVVLGSPSKSPLLARLGDSLRDQALKQIVDEDEESLITPRSVRERPKGLPLPPLATRNAAAIFRGAQLPASSSAPSLLHRHAQQQREEEVASPSASSSGLSHSELDTEPAVDEKSPPEPKHTLSSGLSLPTFYSSLLTLHIALEHALVVHLATAGCSSATLQTSSPPSSSSDPSSPRLVRLPNLISFSSLRPLVERSGGRRLGPTELRRLASVWLDFHPTSSSSIEEVGEVKGLGFIISKTRSLDPRTGKRALDWGIGIELEIKRTVREKTPPPQVGFGGVPVQSSPILGSEGFDESVRGTPKMPSNRFSTPPPSPSPSLKVASSPLLTPTTKGKVKAAPAEDSPKTRSSVSREGMSVVAMWNNGLETRKAEVGRRLRERCARFHQLWLDEKGISVPPPFSSSSAVTTTPTKARHFGLGISAESDDEESPPSPPRGVDLGAGGLLTPSATRTGGRRKRFFHVDRAELDARTLSESEGEDEGEGDLTAGAIMKSGGKQALMEEVSHTVIRSSKSMPSLPPPSSTLPAEGAELKSWHTDFPLNDPKVVAPIPLANLPSLTAPLSTPHRNKQLPPSDALLTPKKPPISTTPSTPGLSLRERIAAKESLRRTSSLSTLPSLTSLSHRALLSRLPELTSIIFMLFSNGTTLSSTGITRSPTIPMQDLLGKLGRSSKVQLSSRECRDALDVLKGLAPGFINVLGGGEGGGGREYVRLGNNAETGGMWRLNEVRVRIAEELSASK